MKQRKITTVVVMGLLLALGAGDLWAAGRGNGGKGAHSMGSAATSTTRPAGSQRRDGTFLTTGTTANGSTTRPSNGRGLQDGSRLAPATTATTTTAAPAQ